MTREDGALSATRASEPGYVCKSGSEFVQLAERVIDELLAADPSLAHDAGDHRFDGLLPDFSLEAVAARVKLLRDASGALSGVDSDLLDPADQVDREQLLSLVERRLFALTETRDHEWNPLVHNPGALLHALLARPFAPAAQRLDSLSRRLGAVPDALSTARENLRDIPQIHLETAVGQFRGTASLVRDEVPRLLAEAPGLAAMVTPAAAEAVAALEGFANWLADRAEPDPGGGDGGRDPRLGRRLWEAKLWHTLDTELTAEHVLRLARESLERISGEIREVSAALMGGRPDDDTVRAALNRLADEHPDDDTIVDLARMTLDEATRSSRNTTLCHLWTIRA